MGKSNNKNSGMSDLCFDCGVCIEKIIWIAGQGDHQSDDFVEFIESESELVEELLNADPYNQPEDVYQDALDAGKLGFLVQLSMAVPEKVRPSGAIWYSAHRRRLKWFYVEKITDIEQEIEPFVAEVIENVRNKGDENGQ